MSREPVIILESTIIKVSLPSQEIIHRVELRGLVGDKAPSLPGISRYELRFQITPGVRSCVRCLNLKRSILCHKYFGLVLVL